MIRRSVPFYICSTLLWSVYKTIFDLNIKCRHHRSSIDKHGFSKIEQLINLTKDCTQLSSLICINITYSDLHRKIMTKVEKLYVEESTYKRHRLWTWYWTRNIYIFLYRLFANVILERKLVSKFYKELHVWYWRWVCCDVCCVWVRVCVCAYVSVFAWVACVCASVRCVCVPDKITHTQHTR